MTSFNSERVDPYPAAPGMLIIIHESHVHVLSNVINEIILNEKRHKVQKFKSEAHVGKRGLVSGRDYLRFANIQEKKLKYIQENTGIYRNQTRVNHVSQCDIQIQYRIYYTSDTQETFTLKDFELYPYKYNFC